ncbi:reverse transcriptase domain-containing protein [Tanacetum coccineum]
MANTDNTNRNTEEREVPVARKCSYKEFMNCQPINFKGSEGAVRLIRWFERTESVFSRSNYTEDYKVKFATGTLTEEALSWKLLIKKYCPRTEELATLCPTMVPDSEKMMKVFIGGLPRSIEGNVTASKPQTLEEAINIAQRLMDQVEVLAYLILSGCIRLFVEIRDKVEETQIGNEVLLSQNKEFTEISLQRYRSASCRDVRSTRMGVDKAHKRDEDDAPLASFSSSFVKMSLNSMIKQEDQESSSLHLPKSLSSRLEQPHSPTRSEDDSSKAKLVNADNSMVTEFVLYDLAHSRRSGSPIPQKTPESKESTGKSTWFCHSDESHGTSPLLDRGRLGGGCDCGGWDMGCPLIVLGNSDIQKAKVCKQSVELFLKGTKEDTPAITMKMTTEGQYAVDFHAQLTSLQAFSICVAILHSTGSSDIVDQNNDRERLQCDSMRVFAEDEVKHLIEVMAEEDKRKPSKNEISPSFLINPPFSPMSRA